MSVAPTSSTSTSVSSNVAIHFGRGVGSGISSAPAAASRSSGPGPSPAGVLRRGGLWTIAGEGPGPLEREAAAGPLEIPEPTPRPKWIATFEDTEVDVDEVGPYAWTERMLSHGAGAVRSGLRHAVVPPGKDTCPPHWHSSENELFVILEGGGSLRLYDRSGALKEDHPVRAGHTVARRAGSGVAHMFRAGPDGMTLLPYGQRNPNEIVFYPRSKKAWVAQAFVRLETVDDYWEGELDHGPDG